MMCSDISKPTMMVRLPYALLATVTRIEGEVAALWVVSPAK